MSVIGVVGGMLIQRAERGVKGLLVPHIEELGRAIAQSRICVLAVSVVRLKIFHRRAERVFELGQIAVHFHILRRAGRHAANAAGERGGLRQDRW